MSDIKQYEPLWGSWFIDEQLGEGSFGKVYKVHKDEFGKMYYAAVKMLSIPQTEDEIERARLEMPEETIPTYFRGFVTDIVQEIDFMSAFKGNTNIVSIEDHKVIKKDDMHWDILIRMELLQSLSSYMTNKPLTPRDVVQLGIDISHALELCAVKNVIHRDIKPDNIFVSDYGDFKLGDFGVARQIRKNSEMSEKGTRSYMAPEVFHNEKDYGPTIDLYSLGIVMYRYLNNNRLPFMPPFPETLTPHSKEDALARRMRGDEPIPDIPDIEPALNDFVLKACAFKPEDRFSTAAEFRMELEKIAGVASKAPVQEIKREFSKPESSKRPRAMRPEEEERTTGVFVLKREQTIAAPKETRPEVPAKIVNILAGVGAVCSGILTLLCLFSGRVSDIFVSMPLYAMCVALCVLNFRLSALNLVTIVWLSCYLIFGAFLRYSLFDYALLSLLLGIMSVEALRSRNRKYRIVLSITLCSCAVVAGILVYMTIRSSGVVSYQVRLTSEYAIPLMMLITAGMVMLPHREDGKILAGLAALEMMPVIALGVLLIAALLGMNYQVLVNIVNANFVGFTPERFRWWRHARLAGVIVQVLACECLVLVAAARMTPEDFLGMLVGKGKAVMVFLASVLVIAAGLFVVALL
ncbi:MAG: serine/threonine protein kinase [Synergistaceae bacterium]|nr:serine/threonine protein kinase [Synergistaceae bacterium]